MKAFYKNDNGLISIKNWQPNCWINVENPTEDEKNYLLNELQIPQAFFNDIDDIDERPRIEIENDWHLIIFRIPVVSEDVKIPFYTIPVGIVFKDEICVSISFHKNEVLSDFVNYTKRKKTDVKDNFDLTLKLLLSSSIWYLKYLKQVNQKIKLAEDNLEKSIKNEELQALLQIEKSLVFFMTSLKGNSIVLHRIKNMKNINLDAELLEDVDIELRQALEMTNIYSDILTGTMDAYASVISNNMNDIMKKMTSISIILMIPTVIASFYGMNVPNSLQENPFGLPIIIAVSLAFSTLGVFLFMKRKWC